MQTSTRAAAVLALAIIGGAVDSVRADAPPTPTPRLPKTGPLIGRGEPAFPRGDARQQSLVDQLDDARINCDLLEMEVAADKAQIEKMMTVLRETELLSVQGFSQGPVLGGSDREEREANVEKYKKKLDRVCAEFVIESKELSRERRRVAELEAELGLTPAPNLAPAPARAARSISDAERVLDLILRGVETWQRGNASAPDERSSPPRPPSPSPTPEERPLKDAERFLDLLRRGIDSWRRDPSAPPEERPGPEQRPGSSGPMPEQSLLKDAERLLDLLRRGVESWQGR
jgi:hypothetical protein